MQPRPTELASRGEGVPIEFREFTPVDVRRRFGFTPGVLSSAGLHLLVVAAVVAPAWMPPAPPPATHLTKLATAFVPAPVSKRATPAELRPPSAGKPLAIRAALELPAPAMDVKVDFSRIQLRFARDVTNELPRVVEAFGGSFALLDKEEPQTVARYLVAPPAWELRAVTKDVSGSWRLPMDEPEKWPLLRNLAQEHAVSLDQYQACALFDPVYGRCVKSAIVEFARRKASSANAMVTSAELVFSSRSPCGVEVLEVSFGPTVQQRF